MTKTKAEAVALLQEIHDLMELNAENPFKVKAFARAIPVVEQTDDLVERAKNQTLTELPGIGKGISEVLTEFLLNNKCPVRDELVAKLPMGLIELRRVPGLGPKKARQLIEELGIHTLGELEYACRENRLLKLKGFGEKIQQKIQAGLQFMQSTQGQARLVDVEVSVEAFLQKVRAALPEVRISETGELRRRLEVLSRLDFLVESAGPSTQKKTNSVLEKFKKENPLTLPIFLHFAAVETFIAELIKTTGSEAHLKALGGSNKISTVPGTEEEAYQKIGLPWIPPESRETGEEIDLAREGKLELLPIDGIKGVFHNHTTRSDGANTLDEMVQAAVELGYQYIGISDHSQSAFYAHGLKSDDLRSQQKEIEAVRKKFPQIKVFWGIESDILADGSLDYEAKVLKEFDFVIASIHSRFNMDREQMTHRILKALQNPHTSFLGHSTGRLLLGRPAYEFETEKIIQEASRRKVAIEINANPARLDIDWRWGPLLRENKTWVSVNPDAHEVAGLKDVRFGVTVARKALLPMTQVLNSLPVREVEQWLKRK